MRYILIFIYFFIVYSQLLCQISTSTNVWYFGRNAGLDFNTSPPTVLFDGAINIWEGCATMCDSNGELLFYTDGRSIWNRNHEIIDGANNLGGSNSSTQSGIIIPVPSSDNRFYVFSVDEQGGSGGLQYSIININLNNNLGGIETANNVLLNQCSEKITAIPHCNNTDYWLIAHEYGGDAFYIWEITNSGISASPILQEIGEVHTGTIRGAIGYMKGSPNGQKIALGVYGGGFFEVFDFDPSSGTISNPILFDDETFVNPYGVEFSPNSKVLYLAGTQNSPKLFQVNLDLNSSDDIQNSRVQLRFDTAI